MAKNTFGDEIQDGQVNTFGDPIESAVAVLPEPVKEPIPPVQAFERAGKVWDAAVENDVPLAVAQEWFFDAIITASDPDDFAESIPDNRTGFSENFKREWTFEKGITKLPIAGGIIGLAQNVESSQAANRLVDLEFDYDAMNRRAREIHAVTMVFGGGPFLSKTLDGDRKRIAQLYKDFEFQSRGKTFGGKLAVGLSALPTWMLEFAATGGLAALGDDVARIAGQKLLRRYAKTKMGKAAIKGAGLVTGAVVRTSTGLLPRVGEKATARQLLIEIGVAGEENWATSLAKAWGDVAIESLSEQTGGIITKNVMQGLVRLPFGGKFISSLQDDWIKLFGGTSDDFVSKMITKGGYSNILGEMSEERVATLLREATGVSDRRGTFGERIWEAMKEDFDPENLGVEFVTLLAPASVRRGMTMGVSLTQGFSVPTEAEQLDQAVGVGPIQFDSLEEAQGYAAKATQVADRIDRDLTITVEPADNTVTVEEMPVEAVARPEPPVTPPKPAEAIEAKAEGVETKTVPAEDLIFREEEQHRIEDAAEFLGDLEDFDPDLMIPISAVRTVDGLLILDGHNRARVLADAGKDIKVVTIDEPTYKRLLTEGFDEIEISAALFDKAKEFDAFSNLEQQFPGADVAERSLQIDLEAQPPIEPKPEGTIEVFHGKFTETKTGKDFGGLHVGTEVAAKQRLDDIFASQRASIGAVGAKELLGEKQIEKLTLNKSDIAFIDEPISETRTTTDAKGNKREGLKVFEAIPRETQVLKDQGFKALAYINATEDPGSISFLVFDEAALVQPPIEAKAETGKRVLFHGGPVEKGKLPTVEKADLTDIRGVFFTADAEAAKFFGEREGRGGVVQEFEVNIKNPATGEIAEQIEAELRAEGIKEPQIFDSVTDELLERGFDSVIRESGVGDEIIVLKDELIAQPPVEAKPAEVREEIPEIPKAKRIISQEAFDAARKRFRDSTKLRVGLDPQQLADAAIIGGFLVESGVRNFAAWSKRMVEQLGDRIKPHLRSIFDEIAKAQPRVEKPVTKKKPAKKKVKEPEFPKNQSVTEAEQIILGEDPLELILTALKKAVAVQPKTEAEKKAELSRRVGAAAGAFESNVKQGMPTVEALFKSTGLLKGPLTEYEQVFDSIEDQLTPEVKEAAYAKISGHPGLRYFEILNTSNSFTKLIQGTALTPGDVTNIENIFGKMFSDVTDIRQQRSELYELILTLWKAGLLTGIKTSGLNIISNAANAMAETAALVPTALIDNAISLHTGERTRAFTVRGYGAGVVEGILKGWKYLRTGYSERNIGEKLDYKETFFGTSKFARALQAYEEFIFHLLGAEDQPFYYGAKGRSIRSQAIAKAITEGLKGKERAQFVKDFIRHPTDEVVNMASEDAKAAVFQNRTNVGDAARAVSKVKPFGFILPFTRTPSSIAVQIVSDYTPIGTVKELIAQIKKGELDQAAISKAFGRSVVGTGALFVGGVLVTAGLMTLDRPKDERERKLWELEGRKPNSIKVGGKWRSVQVLGPLGSTLIIGGHFQRELEKTGSPTKAMVQAMAGGAKSFSEQTFVRGLNQSLSAIADPERSAERWFTSMAGSVVPTLVADIARAADETERRTEGAAQRIRSRIPVLRETLPPRIDVFGQDLPRYGGNVLEVMIDPSRPFKIKSDVVVDELRRLADNDIKVTPTLLGDRKGFDILTVEENTQLWRRSGELTYKILLAWINSEGYKNISNDFTKGKTIDSLVRKTKAAAKAEIVGIKLRQGVSVIRLAESGLLSIEGLEALKFFGK